MAGAKHTPDVFPPVSVICPDCDGTGAEKDDCWLCKGQMSIHWRRAIRERYKFGDLEFFDDDYVRCPSCNGYTCDHCEGDGRVLASVVEQERDRALVMAVDDRREFPPFLYRFHGGGTKLLTDRRLSRAAVVGLRKNGMVHWYVNAVFGDEISLTTKGEEAARVAKVRHTLRCGTAIDKATGAA